MLMFSPFVSINKVMFNYPGVPDTPKMFRAISENATQTSILLSWRSGFHGGAHQTFYIQYKTATTVWQNKTQTDGRFLKDTDFNVTIDKLDPGTVYSFRIFAANVYDRSGFSTPIDATTKPEGKVNTRIMAYQG